ncbi:RAMP superfamily CRISPR-associated protein [Thermosynechococcus sp.]|uniref:RAMP superfamily CRISPR-associated protein n=1 Tax=Thermosynechococcus sp. TaxID=2814275 RepID=UPI00391CF80E
MTSENPALQRPSSNKATQRPNSGNSAPPPRGKGKGNPRNGNQGGPPPWLEHPLDPKPNPDKTAGFVEYLRWMRSPDSPTKDGTKLKLVTKAEQGDYSQRLGVLTQRTCEIAGKKNCFQVTCPWRIRVGGHRGPENMLLPAFDNLGIPYIPSSTLRGVARAQAIREVMKEKGLSWSEADKQVGQHYFGYLDSSNPSEKAGKIIFLDAYPLPLDQQKNGGLAVDITNNLWSWEGNSLKYKANPNVFFSLREVSFLIGLKPREGCCDEKLRKVKEWLIKGLTQGIGSQVNAGYGVLVESQEQVGDGFFRVKFKVKGQLIHGPQEFTKWTWNNRNQQWQMRGQPKAEVRPTAFKSMLRYWFRVFARGVLSPEKVQCLEGLIFGAIQPQPKHGYLRVRVIDGQVTRSEAQGENDPCGEEQGTLVLDYSPEVPDSEKDTLADLVKNLVWLMFHLGGIGQGARRPCYSRQTRKQPPWWRGSDLIAVIAESDDTFFWELPKSAEKFKEKFQERLRGFYSALAKLSNCTIDPTKLLSVGTVDTDQWEEVADKNCRIILCWGNSDSDEEKPYGLALLHDFSLKQNNNYDKNLCGSTGKPSPVWVSNLGDYQIITIFGVNKNPRLKFLKHLNDECETRLQLFPFKSS